MNLGVWNYPKNNLSRNMLSGAQNSHSNEFATIISSANLKIFCVISGGCGDVLSSLMRRAAPCGADCKMEMTTWYSNSFRLIYSAISRSVLRRKSTRGNGAWTLFEMRIDGISRTEMRWRCRSLRKSRCRWSRICADSSIASWILSDWNFISSKTRLRHWSVTSALVCLN